jgi:hypothetical protein
VVSLTPLPLYSWWRIPRYSGPGVHLDDVVKRKFLTLPGLVIRPLCLRKPDVLCYK